MIKYHIILLYSNSNSSDTLISPSGKILIPGIREAVAPLSDEEWKMYQDIEFDIENYKSKIGVSQLMYSNKVNSLISKRAITIYDNVWWTGTYLIILLSALGRLIGPQVALPNCLHPWHRGCLLCPRQ